MSYKEMIAEIKETIKGLTTKQIEDKKVLRQPHDSKTWITQTHVDHRALEISSYLVFYNEIKGKEPSHNLKYKYELAKIKKQYKDVIQKCQVVTAD